MGGAPSFQLRLRGELVILFIVSAPQADGHGKRDGKEGARMPARGDLSRRRFLEEAAIGAAALGLSSTARAATRRSAADQGLKLVPKSEHPPNWETPVAAFLEERTPTDLFFIRSHFEYPQIDRDSWTFSIEGLIEKPISYSLADLEKLPQVQTVAVLQCSGNGRSFHQPKVGGVSWDRGAVGNAEWSGVRLADLLRAAQFKPEAKDIHFISPDGKDGESFLRSIPLDRALAESTLIALRMNGQPLETAHGAPARLVVPGWYGNHWVKWLKGVKVADRPATGHAMESYRMPPRPVPPGTKPKPEEMNPVTGMNIKSLIAIPAPSANATLKPGPLLIQGVAWGGEHPPVKIEVEANGRWRNAEWIDPQSSFGWRRWRARHQAQTGPLRIRCRATDASGQVQPEAPPWNPSGYLWNGWDEAKVQIG